MGDKGNLSYGVLIGYGGIGTCNTANSYNATKYRNDYIHKKLVLFLAVHDIEHNTGIKCQLNCSNKQVSLLKKGRSASTSVVALLSEETCNWGRE